jgi:hypothetical protein
LRLGRPQRQPRYRDCYCASQYRKAGQLPADETSVDRHRGRRIRSVQIGPWLG